MSICIFTVVCDGNRIQTERFHMKICYGCFFSWMRRTMNKEEHYNDPILYSIILVTEQQTTESFYRNQYPRSELEKHSPCFSQLSSSKIISWESVCLRCSSSYLIPETMSCESCFIIQRITEVNISHLINQ